MPAKQTGSTVEPVTEGVPSPGTMTIGPGDVHAWLIDTDGWPADRVVLDAGERERSASYLRPLDSARFAASRSAVRFVMSAYLGVAPGRLRFAPDGAGRPTLAGHHLQLSLSRSGGVALLAVSADPVGADLELVRPRAGLADLAAARFGEAEAACIAGGCAGSPASGFYRHWVAREAYLKATGRGLAALRDTELACGPPAVIRFRGTAELAWCLTLTDGSAGYVAAVAAARPVTAWHQLRMR